MKKTLCKLSLCLIAAVLMTACWSDTTYRDADYPDQIIYMPAAYNNNQFVIDNISTIRGQLPIEGNPYRYVIDVAKNEFRVPLSAYRVGINNKGSFTVDINVNTDIITTINQGGATPYVTIPSGKYSLANSAEMKNGEELAIFDLVVDLNLLRENFPSTIFALGVEISSKQRERNPDKSITAVIINTRMIKPTANFTYQVTGRNVTFTGSSTMASDYRWNFGDGTSSTVASPTHAYASVGTYLVTLTALGATGELDKSEKTIEIKIE